LVRQPSTSSSSSSAHHLSALMMEAPRLSSTRKAAAYLPKNIKNQLVNAVAVVVVFSGRQQLRLHHYCLLLHCQHCSCAVDNNTQDSTNSCSQVEPSEARHRTSETIDRNRRNKSYPLLPQHKRPSKLGRSRPPEVKPEVCIITIAMKNKQNRYIIDLFVVHQIIIFRGGLSLGVVIS